MLILGIDPGTARMGYGLVKIDSGRASLARMTFVDAGCLETKMETPMHERLWFLFGEIEKILEKYQPDVLAVESIFFGINAKTGIAVSQARGVILAAAAKCQIPTVVEYQGLSIKFALTGFGRSDKKQVQEAVRKSLKMKEIIKPDDAADGLAIAITHYIKTCPKDKSLPSRQ